MQLYTFPETFGLRNVSPFCLKVEMALAHLGQNYEIVLESNPHKSPKGKLPYIIDGDLTLADSELILEYLDEKTGGGLYGGLSDDERARGVAFTRLIEDHLYWILVASRWVGLMRSPPNFRRPGITLKESSRKSAYSLADPSN